jgi:hypothetical protein
MCLRTKNTQTRRSSPPTSLNRRGAEIGKTRSPTANDSVGRTLYVIWFGALPGFEQHHLPSLGGP